MDVAGLFFFAYLFCGSEQVENVSSVGNEDVRLLASARNGDEASFLALYHEHRTPLFRFAWRLTGSEATAEDSTQECFLTVLSAKGYDASLGSLRAYLFGISRNLIRKRLRMAEREEDEEDAVDPSAVGGPLESLLSAERAEAVAHAVASLPPNQREAVILFEYEGLSLDEIGTAVGIDTGAVKARLHRARETLRRRLAPLLGLRQQQRRHS